MYFYLEPRLKHRIYFVDIIPPDLLFTIMTEQPNSIDFNDISLFEVPFNEYGILVFKPDAVQLGIVEMVLQHTMLKLLPNVELIHLEIIDLNNQDIKVIYPWVNSTAKHSISNNMLEYLSENASVICIFKRHNDSNIHVTNLIQELKGPMYTSWRDDDLINANGTLSRKPFGLEDFIRGIHPVPGAFNEKTLHALYKKVLLKRFARRIRNKLKYKHNNNNLIYTEPEQSKSKATKLANKLESNAHLRKSEKKAHIRTLVHSPDSQEELNRILFVLHNYKPEIITYVQSFEF